MQEKIFEQTSEEELDYVVNWVNWLGSDTISSSSWEAETGLTLENDENTTTSTLVWVSDGDSGKTYWAKNTIVTAAGRTKTFKICFKINDGCCRESDGCDYQC
jgi:hypothetical protein